MRGPRHGPPHLLKLGFLRMWTPSSGPMGFELEIVTRNDNLENCKCLTKELLMKTRKHLELNSNKSVAHYKMHNAPGTLLEGSL